MAAHDYSHRQVWAIAGPLIVSNVSVPLLGIVDTAVMGHLDQPFYLGAVAVGAVIFSFLYMGFNFLRMGTTGLAAQAHGTGSAEQVRTVLAQAILTALGLALLLIVLQVPIRHTALRLMSASPEVSQYAAQYYGIRIWSAPAALANFALVGWFIGMQNARGPLVILLVTNLINIALDLVFVVGLGMKTEGVALASVIADYSGLAVGLAMVPGLLRRWPGRWRQEHILDRDRFRALLSINGNLLIRTMSLMFAFAFLTSRSAIQGNVILAANAVLLNLQYFMAYALDGFANAAEALVGRAIGARDREGFKRAVRLSMYWSMGVAGVFCLAYLAAGRPMIHLMTDLEDIREGAARYLPWMIVSPLISVWSFTYDGIYVGATRATEMRNTMLLSTFGVFVPAWYLLQPLGNHGLWLAFMCFMAARGLSMHVLFRRLDARGAFGNTRRVSDTG